MNAKAATRLGAAARVTHRAGEQRDRSKNLTDPQVFALASGGLLDLDSAADAIAWGRALEGDAARWLHARGRLRNIGRA